MDGFYPAPAFPHLSTEITRSLFLFIYDKSKQDTEKIRPRKPSREIKIPSHFPDFVPEHQNQKLIYSVDSQSIFSQEARRKEYAVVLGSI